jgi:hypothetical protein
MISNAAAMGSNTWESECSFRAHMEERNYLVKEVFPFLRKKAKERDVQVVDEYLPWGITEE